MPAGTAAASAAAVGLAAAAAATAAAARDVPSVTRGERAVCGGVGGGGGFAPGGVRGVTIGGRVAGPAP